MDITHGYYSSLVLIISTMSLCITVSLPYICTHFISLTFIPYICTHFISLTFIPIHYFSLIPPYLSLSIHPKFHFFFSIFSSTNSLQNNPHVSCQAALFSTSPSKYIYFKYFSKYQVPANVSHKRVIRNPYIKYCTTFYYLIFYLL